MFDGSLLLLLLLLLPLLLILILLPLLLLLILLPLLLLLLLLIFPSFGAFVEGRNTASGGVKGTRDSSIQCTGFSRTRIQSAIQGSRVPIKDPEYQSRIQSTIQGSRVRFKDPGTSIVVLRPSGSTDRSAYKDVSRGQSVAESETSQSAGGSSTGSKVPSSSKPGSKTGSKVSNLVLQVAKVLQGNS